MKRVSFKKFVFFLAVLISFLLCFSVPLSTARASEQSVAISVSDGRYVLNVNLDCDYTVVISNTETHTLQFDSSVKSADVHSYLLDGENLITVVANSVEIFSFIYTVSLQPPSKLYFLNGSLHFSADESSQFHLIYADNVLVGQTCASSYDLSACLLTAGVYSVSVVSGCQNGYSMPSYINVSHSPSLSSPLNLSVAYLNGCILSWSKTDKAQGYIVTVSCGGNSESFHLTQNYLLYDGKVDSFTVTAYADGYLSATSEWTAPI